MPPTILKKPPKPPDTPLPRAKAPSWFELAAQTLGGALGLPPLSAEDYDTPEGGQSIDRAGALGELLTMGMGVGTLGAAMRGPKAAKGTLGQATRIPNPIKAYHGSPHDFDQFSLSKIGTGEGAQAYGHGLYFAEDAGTANYYKDALAKGFEYQGQPVDPRTSLGRDLDFLNSSVRAGESMTEVLPKRIKELREHAAFMRKAEPNYGSDVMYDRAADALAKLDPAKLKRAGRTYEVNIHASPDELLDWDKPLSEQSQKVREATMQAYGDVRPVKLGNGRYAVTIVSGDQSGRVMYAIDEATAEGAMTAFREQYPKYASGSDIYHDLQRFADLNPGIASDSLKAKGIKGIQYLDQGSRAKTYDMVVMPRDAQGREQFMAQLIAPGNRGTKSPLFGTEREAKAWAEKNFPQPTRNFVIFDDQLIEIKNKFGFATVAAAAEWVRQQGGTVEKRGGA